MSFYVAVPGRARLLEPPRAIARRENWPYYCSTGRLNSPYTETNMSSFSTYLIGFFVLIIGLAIAAYLLNVPSTWILVGVVVALGIGILTATTRTKTKDPPGPPVA